MEIYYSSCWTDRQPFFTVITPIYNRRATIKRTIDSVISQTFSDYEYIIIDDGSSQSSDDIIFDFLNATNMPAMYVKKENGGVHTARNVGYKYARGKFVVCIDSDDELLPDALSIFYNEYNLIPEETRSEYWQIKALCVDQTGRLCSDKFPEEINLYDKDKAFKFFSMAKGEQIGCRVANIMKNNPFPEPDGVKFVPENLLWLILEKKYKSWGSNKSVRIYHTEGEDHLIKSNTKMSLQNCKNKLWESKYRIDNKNIFTNSLKKYLVALFKYCVFKHILKKKEKEFIKNNKLNSRSSRFVEKLLWIPSFIYSKIFYKKRCMGF